MEGIPQGNGSLKAVNVLRSSDTVNLGNFTNKIFYTFCTSTTFSRTRFSDLQNLHSMSLLNSSFVTTNFLEKLHYISNPVKPVQSQL